VTNKFEKSSSPRQLGPGERLIDGQILYSSAWLDDPPEITEGQLYLIECNSAPDEDEPEEAA
jgi:hypothetical protein